MRKATIYICFETTCRAKGSKAVYEEFVRLLEEKNLDADVVPEIKKTGCHGPCQQGVLVHISPYEYTYIRVKPSFVETIIDETIVNGRPVEKYMLFDKAQKTRVASKADWSFFQKQKRLVLDRIGWIDPENIDDYLAAGGYRGMEKALAMPPQAVVDEIIKSGLRGRGGGGFSTGRKWLEVKKITENQKYVICNGDEGDPGAFMDRCIMEGAPHLVLEGMTIAAHAVEASKGFIYVRNEYPFAVAGLQNAINQARKRGYLGNNIRKSGFEFDIEIKRGAGAFVCGESSALMRSIEGKIGEPRTKYIHATEKGLWDKPSLLNNVETYANVPFIVENGAAEFCKIGTSKSTGTKVFSLVGKIKNNSLVEVPMGTPLREIIYDIGGGIPKKRLFKAVQTGGPSGGCLPEALLDLPIDFDSLVESGSIMGSGGMIVMDNHDCMVEVARYFIGFLIGESCGKCTPCREGLVQMHNILTRITKGQGREDDIPLLLELCEYLKDSALCGLGKSAPNPVLSTLRYFKDEYLDHIRNKHCPAGVCKDLVTFSIDVDICTDCGICQKGCPVNAIERRDNDTLVINQDTCTRCGLCFDSCPFNCIDT